MGKKTKAPTERFGLPDPPSDTDDTSDDRTDGAEVEEEADADATDEVLSTPEPLITPKPRPDPPVDRLTVSIGRPPEPERAFSEGEEPKDAVWLQGRAMLPVGRNRGGHHWPHVGVVRPVTEESAREVEADPMIVCKRLPGRPKDYTGEEPPEDP